VKRAWRPGPRGPGISRKPGPLGRGFGPAGSASLLHGPVRSGSGELCRGDGHIVRHRDDKSRRAGAYNPFIYFSLFRTAGDRLSERGHDRPTHGPKGGQRLAHESCCSAPCFSCPPWRKWPGLGQSTGENRTLAPFPKLTQLQGISRALPGRPENLCQRSLRAAQPARGTPTASCTIALASAPAKDVVIGKDGWLFYYGGPGFWSQHTGRPTSSKPDELDKWVRQNGGQPGLAGANATSPFYMVAAPDKNTIYPEINFRIIRRPAKCDYSPGPADCAFSERSDAGVHQSESGPTGRQAEQRSSVFLKRHALDAARSAHRL